MFHGPRYQLTVTIHQEIRLRHLRSVSEQPPLLRSVADLLDNKLYVQRVVQHCCELVVIQYNILLLQSQTESDIHNDV